MSNEILKKQKTSDMDNDNENEMSIDVSLHSEDDFNNMPQISIDDKDLTKIQQNV